MKSSVTLNVMSRENKEGSMLLRCWCWEVALRKNWFIREKKRKEKKRETKTLPIWLIWKGVRNNQQLHLSLEASTQLPVGNISAEAVWQPLTTPRTHIRRISDTWQLIARCGRLLFNRNCRRTLIWWRQLFSYRAARTPHAYLGPTLQETDHSQGVSLEELPRVRLLTQSKCDLKNVFDILVLTDAGAERRYKCLTVHFSWRPPRFGNQENVLMCQC